LKEAQPENPEGASRVNGMDTNQKTSFEPDESQTTMSDQPHQGKVEDVTGWPEWYVEVQPMEAGTLSQPLEKKDKQQVPRSPHKKPITSIILLRIPDGVWVKSDLLGFVERIKYSEHNVMDTENFLEFAKKFFLQTMGMDAFGKLINQPL
jgi:hypothetical protein